MAGVGAEVVDPVSGTVEKVNVATKHLTSAGEPLAEFQRLLELAAQGTAADEVGQAMGLAAEAAQAIPGIMGLLSRVSADLAAYAAGLAGDSAATTTPRVEPKPPAPSVPPGPRNEPEHVRKARQEVAPPVQPRSGQKTHGRWAAGDGAAGMQAIVSRQDEYQLAGLGIANGAVAAHVETKIAAHMAANSLTDVTLTINNVPCKGPWSCDKVIPALLPEESALTVYGESPAGTRIIKRYTGGATL